MPGRPTGGSPSSATYPTGQTKDHDHVPEIHVINADGSGQRRLTSDTGFEGNPAWSPDGRRIAFTIGHEGHVVGGGTGSTSSTPTGPSSGC